MLQTAAEVPSNAFPRAPTPPPRRNCRECGQPFYATRHDQEFCLSTCRQKYHKRRYERGAQLYDFAMEWRGKRLKGGFTRLCQMVDDWLREERDRARAHQAMRER